MSTWRTGSTWVLLRGLTRESRHWGEFPTLLRAALPSVQVVTLDLPGNGALNAERSPTHIGAMSRHCADSLQRLRIAPPYHVLAVSMGAMVAVDWAARDPGAIAACVLVNTSLRPFNPWFQRLRPGNLLPLLRLVLWPQSAASQEALILRLTSRNPQAAAAVLPEWTALRQQRPVSTANAVRQLCAAARFSAPAQAPAVPMLVLNSAGDTLVDPRCSQQLARRWGADLVVHPSAGHDLPLDDGPWVALQIARWVQALSSDPQTMIAATRSQVQ